MFNGTNHAILSVLGLEYLAVGALAQLVEDLVVAQYVFPGGIQVSGTWPSVLLAFGVDSHHYIIADQK